MPVIRRAEAEQGSWRRGVAPSEVCASIVHHYATARSAASALTAAVERGLVPELETYEEPYGRTMRRRIRTRTGGGGPNGQVPTPTGQESAPGRAEGPPGGTSSP